MALDHLISIKHQAPGGRNDFGEYEEGALTTLDVWATRIEADLVRTLQEGGTRTDIGNVYQVRYIELIATAPIDQVTLTDGQLDELGELVVHTITKISPVRPDQQRRRFLNLELAAQ